MPHGFETGRPDHVAGNILGNHVLTAVLKLQHRRLSGIERNADSRMSNSADIEVFELRLEGLVS